MLDQEQSIVGIMSTSQLGLYTSPSSLTLKMLCYYRNAYVRPETRTSTRKIGGVSEVFDVISRFEAKSVEISAAITYRRYEGWQNTNVPTAKIPF